MKLPVYNSAGDKVKEIELSSRIFGVKANKNVVHQIVVAQEANSRQVLAHTKTKGEVRGGGKKPWAQKGTGQARQGSIRAPQWKGGGVIFGPRNNRNYSLKVNKKQKQLALAMCLSEKAADGKLAIFENLNIADGKTKALNAWLKVVKEKAVSGAKKFLVVLDHKDETLTRAAFNLKNMKTILADSLNCVDVLKYDTLITSEKGVAVIEKHYQLIKEKKEKTK